MNKKYKESTLGTKTIGLIESLIAFTSIMFLIAGGGSLSFDILGTQVNEYAKYAFGYVALFLSIGISIGLYDSGSRENFRSVFKRIVFTHVLSTGGVFIAASVFSFDGISAIDAALVFILNAFSISYMRYHVLNSNVEGLGAKRTLIIGAGEKASFVQERMRRKNDKLGIRLMGFVKTKNDKFLSINEDNLINLKDGLLNFVLTNKVTHIVIANDNEGTSEYIEDLAACKLQGVSIVPLFVFIEKQLGAIPVDMLSPSELIYSDGFKNRHRFYKITSWLVNMLLSSVLILLTWPIMLITALLIKLEDGWKNPVLYKQIRIGEDGKEFEIIKFRSMITDAEKNGAMMAAKNDARVTRVGAKIRKYRIDELPQVINVLRGEMAFVGPRPERPVFVDELTKKFPYYHERHNIKPGLTGWAQLKYPYGECEKDSLEKLRFDMYYVKHQGLLLDILIIMRTVEIVLFGKGR